EAVRPGLLDGLLPGRAERRIDEVRARVDEQHAAALEGKRVADVVAEDDRPRLIHGNSGAGQSTTSCVPASFQAMYGTVQRRRPFSTTCSRRVAMSKTTTSQSRSDSRTTPASPVGRPKATA